MFRLMIISILLFNTFLSVDAIAKPGDFATRKRAIQNKKEQTKQRLSKEIADAAVVDGADCPDCFINGETPQQKTIRLRKEIADAAVVDGADCPDCFIDGETPQQKTIRLRKEIADAAVVDGTDCPDCFIESQKKVLKAIPVEKEDLDTKNKPTDCDQFNNKKYKAEYDLCIAIVKKQNHNKALDSGVSAGSDCKDCFKDNVEKVSKECSVVKFEEISCPEGTYTFTSGKNGKMINDNILRKAKEKSEDNDSISRPTVRSIQK